MSVLSGKGRLSLTKAIVIRFSLIILAVAILLTILAIVIGKVQDTKVDVALANEERNTLYQATIDHYDWVETLLLAIASEDDFSGQLDPTQCSFGQTLYGNEMQNNPDYAEFISNITLPHRQLHEAASEIIEIPISDSVGRLDIYENEIKPNLELIHEHLNSEIAKQFTKIEALEAQLDSDVNVALAMCAIATLLILVVCFVTLHYLRGEVILPMVRFTNESRRLAEGSTALDFSTNCKTKEMWGFSHSMEEATGVLQHVISDLNEKMALLANKDFSIELEMDYKGDFASIEQSMSRLISEIRTIMIEIQNSGSIVTAEAQQVSFGSTQLANSSMEQAGISAALSDSITSMATQVSETAENANEANHLGEQVTTVIVESAEKMQEMQIAISDIQNATTDIEKIIKTIDSIAFQTNILALNAAVEAARSGQAGKGFAVVADEVRNLAQKSTEAANSTTMLIRNTLDTISHGTTIAREAYESFGKVEDSSREVLIRINEIAKTSKVQSTVIQEISDSMNQIYSVVQQNTATSEESAAASQELFAQANSLQELTSDFRLK